MSVQGGLAFQIFSQRVRADRVPANSSLCTREKSIGLRYVRERLRPLLVSGLPGKCSGKEKNTSPDTQAAKPASSKRCHPSTKRMPTRQRPADPERPSRCRATAETTVSIQVSVSSALRPFQNKESYSETSDVLIRQGLWRSLPGSQCRIFVLAPCPSTSRWVALRPYQQC